MPRTLIALGTAHATCADTDGDGFAGLTRLEADFRSATSDTRYRVVLSATGADIDSTGVHEISLEIAGTAPVSGPAYIRITPRRPPQRR